MDWDIPGASFGKSHIPKSWNCDTECWPSDIHDFGRHQYTPDLRDALNFWIHRCTVPTTSWPSVGFFERWEFPKNKNHPALERL